MLLKLNSDPIANLMQQKQLIETEISKVLGTHGTAYIFNCVKPIFEVDEKVEAIQWTQYTPYFNDGEPCYFNINWHGNTKISNNWHEIYSLIYYVNHKPEQLANTGLDIQYWTAEKIKELNDASAEISYNLNEAEDILQQIYGDGYSVCMNRNGEVIVEEFDHD